jgi:hypothetical protein
VFRALVDSSLITNVTVLAFWDTLQAPYGNLGVSTGA